MPAGNSVGFTVPSVNRPTSRLWGCSPLHHSPCASALVILIIVPFSRPFPGLWGSEGSIPFLMRVERLPCVPPGPSAAPRRGCLAAVGAPFWLWGSAAYLIPESGASAAGCFTPCSSAASSSLIAACLAVVFLPPCQSKTRIVL